LDIADKYLRRVGGGSELEETRRAGRAICSSHRGRRVPRTSSLSLSSPSPSRPRWSRQHAPTWGNADQVAQSSRHQPAGIAVVRIIACVEEPDTISRGGIYAGPLELDRIVAHGFEW